MLQRWLVRNLLFPLHERVKGHPTCKILRDMEAADAMSAAELESLSSRRLRDLIQYCYAHVPYVRDRMKECGVTPSEIQSAEDLPRLPLMTKAEIRAKRAQMRSTLARKLVPYSTTGSMGDPLLFDLSKERVASRVAARQRVTRWWGLSVGDPEFAIWGSPVELTRQDWLRKMRDQVMATRLLPAFEMNEATTSRYLDLIGKGGSKHLFGYPSSIYLLCLQARAQGRDLRRAGVRVVFVTGEVLWPHQRKLISEVMNCPVADGYGGRDSGFISHECPQGGMHILADAIMVEVVDADGRPVPSGESGEIVVTDLYSHEVPLIRYTTGDRGVLSSRRCPCGRSLPVFERIEGRTMDFFITADGRTIPGGSVFYAFYGVDGVEQFRIFQKEVDRFHIQIVVGSVYRPESEAQIREGIERRMRSPLRITFEYLPVFPQERTGKFRCIVSEVAGVPTMGPR